MLRTIDSLSDVMAVAILVPVVDMLVIIVIIGDVMGCYNIVQIFSLCELQRISNQTEEPVVGSVEIK